ncbi:hypothetical protein NST18_15075 [Anoxybacillus sp. FSL W8-0104]
MRRLEFNNIALSGLKGKAVPFVDGFLRFIRFPFQLVRDREQFLLDLLI